MSRLKIFILLLSAIFLTSCHHYEEPEKTARRTVIIYMAGENSLTAYYRDDINEMLLGKGQIPLDCNLVVYVDNTSMPTVYTFSAQTGQSTWKIYPEHDSCDSITFSKNLADIIKAFPAEHYGLVMWSHGSGWLPQTPVSRSATSQRKDKEMQVPAQHKTIGVDNNQNNFKLNFGTELEIPAMRRMLEQLGVHWDYIFFDACFMQCVEVDYELRKLCDYVIGSPAEIPGDGAPYAQIMSALFADEGGPEQLCERYYDAYKNNYGLIISAVRTSELEAFAQATKPLVQTIFKNHRQYDMDGVQKYGIFDYGSIWKTEFYDVSSGMHALLGNDVAYLEWEKELNKILASKYFTNGWMSIYYEVGLYPYIYDKEHISTISMHFPHAKYDVFDFNAYLHEYEWYKAVGFDQTGW